jgi:hypothetical protein
MGDVSRMEWLVSAHLYIFYLDTLEELASTNCSIVEYIFATLTLNSQVQKWARIRAN